jgi:ubiquinone/menaquinone biosynthesis C-methylase UbiE
MKNRLQFEFARQSKSVSSAETFKSASILGWFRREVACGPGSATEAVSPLTREITGSDATPAMNHLARERCKKAHLTNACFEVAPAEAMPFKKAGFNKVITRLSLRHFVDIQAVLYEARRVLSPHGILIAADLVSSDETRDSALHNSLEQLRDPRHIRMRARTEWMDAIESAGLELVSDLTQKHEGRSRGGRKSFLTRRAPNPSVSSCWILHETGNTRG